MKGKVFCIPFLRPQGLGPYFCPDGELELNAEGVEENGGSTWVSGLAGERDVEVKAAVDAESFTPRLSLEHVVLTGWQNHPDNLPSREVEAPKERTLSAWGLKAREVAVAFHDEAKARGLYTEPFLAFAAACDGEGRQLAFSPPVLMIPNSGAPHVVGGEDLDCETMQMSVVASACRLKCDIDSNRMARLKQSGVEAIEVYTMASMPLFDEKGTPLPYHRVTDTNYTHSLSADGVGGERQISGKQHLQAWRMAATDLAVVPASWPAELPASNWLLTDFKAAHGASVAGRVTMSDLTVKSGAAWPLETLCATPETRGGTRALVSVSVRKNGKTVRSERFLNSDAAVKFDSDNFPRWIFHPDPDAVSMTVTTDKETFTIPLKRHPTLGGAYFFRGLQMDADIKKAGVKISPLSLSANAGDHMQRDTYLLPSTLCRSRADHNGIFPDNLIMRIDTPRVIACVRAFRTSGLVATTVPTAYLFTEGGIYLLKECKEGMFTDAGLIGAYTLGDPSSLRVDGTRLWFTTAGGEELCIDGSRIKKASETVAASDANIIIGGEGEKQIVTKPLKLGSPETRKRIGALGVRGLFDASQCRIGVYGSDDMNEWRLLAAGPLPQMGCLWLPPRRFFKAEIAVRLREGDMLEGLVVGLK